MINISKETLKKFIEYYQEEHLKGYGEQAEELLYSFKHSEYCVLVNDGYYYFKVELNQEDLNVLKNLIKGEQNGLQQDIKE